jgi:hypothetical protein
MFQLTNAGAEKIISKVVSAMNQTTLEGLADHFTAARAFTLGDRGQVGR